MVEVRHWPNLNRATTVREWAINNAAFNSSYISSFRYNLLSLYCGLPRRGI